MVDCITIFNSACIACTWCILFSVCFPRFSKNLRKVDSSECCVRRKPMQKHRRARSHDFPRCVRTSLVQSQRRFKDSPCYVRNREAQRECRSCRKEKTCARSKEHRNVRQCTECMERNRKTSQICSRQAKHSNSYNKSDDSLNKKNSAIADLKADNNEHRVCKRS